MSEPAAAMAALLTWIESAALARWVGGSLPATAALSAVHALGFTVVLGGAVVFNLRLLGGVLAARPSAEIAAGAARVVATGLVLSVATGLLLFSAKAGAVAANEFFQMKMLFLAGAALLHFLACRHVERRHSAVAERLIGAAGVALWIALALAACAFFLLE